MVLIGYDDVCLSNVTPQEVEMIELQVSAIICRVNFVINRREHVVNEFRHRWTWEVQFIQPQMGEK